MKIVVALGMLFLGISPASAATLSLSPSTLTLKPGEQTAVTVTLDPQSQAVMGTDIYLTYSPSYLKIISVVNLKVFPGMPSTIIHNDLGSTKFSLIHNYGQYQNVPAEIATITLEALNPVAATTLGFEFTPGSSRDTNVAIAQGQDILSQVKGVDIKIVGLSPTPTPTSQITPNPEPTVTPTLSPSSRPGTLPAPTRRPITPPPQTLTSPPLAHGFISPLGPTTPSQKPTPPLTNQVLGVTSPAPTASPFSYFFLGSIVTALLITLGYIVHLLKQKEVTQEFIPVYDKLH